MKRILLIAAFLYLFIAPFTYHPDNKEVLFWASSAKRHGLEYLGLWRKILEAKPNSMVILRFIFFWINCSSWWLNRWQAKGL